MSNDAGLLPGLLTFLALAVIGALPLLTRKGARFPAALFLGGYALRFGLSVALYGFGLVDWFRDEDGQGWLVGLAFSEEWQRQGIGLFDIPGAWAGAYGGKTHLGYYFLVATLFHFTGPSRLAAAALNGAFGAWTAVVAYRTARSLFSEYVARRVGLWLAFFPSLILWSAQTVKEPAVILLEVLVVYGCVHLGAARLSVRHLILTVACIALLAPFRFYAAYLALAAVGAALAARALGERRGGPLLGLAVVGGALVASGLLAGREAPIEGFDIEYVSRFRKFAAQGGSGVASDYDLRTADGLGLAVVEGAAHLLLAPFPWQLLHASPRMLLVAPEMAYWWWLCAVGLGPGLAHALGTRLRAVLPMLVLLIGFGVLYSMMFANIGLVYRQRAQLLPWLFTFCALGLERRALRRRGGPMDEPPVPPRPPEVKADRARC